MKNVRVVIGSNYGDEGKGNTTNYLANEDSIVVRFNGGAQAGHTVVHDGIRHVFHSIGSGSMKGAATFWGPHFAIDPIMFFKEVDEFHCKMSSKFKGLKVFADPMCPIVTPYDVLINQAIERKRSNGRHGSCGMGFGETIARNKTLYEFKLADISRSIELCNEIEEEYFYPRVQDLDLEIDGSISNLMKLFFKELDCLRRHVITATFEDIDAEFDDIIFEGAQGLCLDQNSPDFPHVTYSNTGLDNVIKLLDPERHSIEVYYVTRPYLTRHGAGNLKNECEKPANFIDKTNEPNEFQGTLRFAPLDFERMKNDINTDFNKAVRFERSMKLAITCCDQMPHAINEIPERLSVSDHIDCWSADGIWTSVFTPIYD